MSINIRHLLIQESIESWIPVTLMNTKEVFIFDSISVCLEKVGSKALDILSKYYNFDIKDSRDENFEILDHIDNDENAIKHILQEIEGTYVIHYDTNIDSFIVLELEHQ